MILADMPWQGKQYKVIWHAPKNGFFFVIDRETGTPLSIELYTKKT
ncbi:MAG: quinohemoprotein ethanol dehydrogenase [Flavobacteriales bacterium]|jgi:glucose dehydrogenase